MTMKQLIAFAALALLGASFAFAQETTGDIIGTVTSEDRVALPGVTVTAEDVDTGLRRSATSNAGGLYRIAALPPAGYSVTANLEGFQTVRRSVKVDLGRTVTNNLTLQLGAFTETIEVSGEEPQIDPTSTVAGITVNTDDLNARLPIAREAAQLALLAPGTIPGDFFFNPGYFFGPILNTPGQRLTSMRGASVAENSYQVNGLNITNFRNGVGSSRVPFEFLEQAQVKTGGYEAEFGRATGGVINMVTKSGSNTLRGVATVYFHPESLQGSMANTVYSVKEEERLESLEANASVGGALVRDRLFYYLFVSYADEDLLTMGGGRGERWQSQEPYWGGKVDWNVTPGHRLEGTYFSDETEVDRTLIAYERGVGFGDVINTGQFLRGGSNAILKYSGILSDSFMLSAQYGVNQFERTDRTTGDECPRARDLRRQSPPYGIGCWVWWAAGTDSDERDAYRLDVDLFVGRHSLRAGIDVEDNLSSHRQTYSGDIYYAYYLNGTEEQEPEDYWFSDLPWDQELVRVRHWRQGGDYPVESRSAYVQDSWAATPDLTVNLGIRYEEYDNKNSLGETFIRITDQWAPRVGAVWDVGGDGRSKLYGSYGLYHLPVASFPNIWLAGGTYEDEGWYTLSGGIDPLTGEPGQLEDELLYHVLADGVAPDPRETRSDELEPMSQWEAILGYERMAGERWSLGVRGVALEFNDIIEDVLLAQALWEVYGVECLSPDLIWEFEGCFHQWQQHARLTNPGRGFTGWYDLHGDGVLEPISLTAEEIGLPDPERKYYAVELTATRRFADRWMLHASYTWSHSYGNYEGWVDSDIHQADAGLNMTWDTAGIMENSSGNLANDRRHSLKLFGAYRWDVGLQLGANSWYRTGRPLSGFGYHPSDPWANALADFFGHPVFYILGEPCPRGSAGTTDDAWSLDLMLRYDWRWAATDWHLRVDAYNVFDNGAVTAVEQYAEWPMGTPFRNYLEPIDFQEPRRVRFGFGVSF
jgi:hypothetical protein